jgi:lysozyme family protein
MTEHERFDRCMVEEFVHEGGFVNDPQDPGGMTNLGATKRVWEEWVGHPVTEAAMRALTQEAVKPLYHSRYWLAASCDKLPAGVDLMVLDTAINMGVSRACKYLQSAAGVTADGHVGPQTLAAVATRDPAVLLSQIYSLRGSFYRASPNFPRFGKGWLRRLNEVRVKAESWL